MAYLAERASRFFISVPSGSCSVSCRALQLCSALLRRSVFQGGASRTAPQMGGIDEAALDRLALVTELTRLIRVRSSVAGGWAPLSHVQRKTCFVSTRSAVRAGPRAEAAPHALHALHTLHTVKASRFSSVPLSRASPLPRGLWAQAPRVRLRCPSSRRPSCGCCGTSTLTSTRTACA